MARDLSLPGPVLEEVRRELRSWRRARRGGGRIPDRFWRAAVELSQRLGMDVVSRELGLCPDRLERRYRASGSGKGGEAQRAFVELVDVLPPGKRECHVELTDGQGGRMTVHLLGGTESDLAVLAETFWRKQK